MNRPLYRQTLLGKVVAWSFLGFVLALLAENAHAGQSNTFELAFGAEALDSDQCRQVVGEKSAMTAAPVVLGTLGYKGGEAWALGRAARGETTVFQYIVALKNPVAVGSCSLSASEGWGLVSRKLQYLKGDGKADDAASWIDVPLAAAPGAHLYTFPAGTSAKVFRVVETRTDGEAKLSAWSFFKKRFFSLNSEATGIGERGPFAWHPNQVVNGQLWVNAALNPDPSNKETRILRAPVSDIDPSWFILMWDAPRDIAGVLLRSNAAKFKLYSYSGNPNLNPALATADDWTRIDYSVARTLMQHQEKQTPATHWLAFSPVKTQAIKILVNECTSKAEPVFSIATFAALSDLGDAAVPAQKSDDAPAYQFPYTLSQAGDTAMAIRSLDGKHIRTLFAQIEKTAGEQIAHWDLKDDQGRTVQPGSYKFEALNAPPIELHYEMTVTPNVETRSADRTPWHQDYSGPHGWLADHAMGTTVTTAGDRVFFGAPGVEGGTSFIECDLNGVKQWGRVNFGAWTGPQHLGSDGKYVFVHAGNNIYRMDPATHEFKDMAPANTPQRKGWMHSLTGHAGKLYLARSSNAPFIDNAAADWQVDLDACLPLYPKNIKGTFRTVPNPRVDFLRVLRLTGTPPGQDNNNPEHWPIYLDTTRGGGRRQHVVVAFKEPLAIGSLVFPHPGGKEQITFSALKPNAPYPPNPARAADWQVFEQNGKAGTWDCIPAPANTLTRALRITFTQPGDEVDDLLAGPEINPAAAAKSGLDGGDVFAKTSDEGDLLGDGGDKKKSGWAGRLEGLKILRRRVASLSSTAKVRVNSGAVGNDGVWDAKRTESITPQNPGVYVMEWDAAQKVCGVAFKEVDGAKTEVDVWVGAETGAIPLDGTEGWKTVGTYKQARRLYYEPDFNRNQFARYVDGYVNFEEEIKTRAVRLRVVEQWVEQEHYPHGIRADLGGMKLEPWRCRIFGVAALTYIGGEVPLDTGMYRGLDVVDSNTGKLIETVRCDPGYSLATNAAGELFTLRELGIHRIDTKTGAPTPIVQNLKNPERLAIGPDGSFYVYCGKDSGYVVRAFDKDGKHLRDIGTPGGIKPGPWDPKRLSNVNAIAVDKDNNLWVMDTNDQPRRTVQFKTDGTFVRELLGNTHYGGGGTLNRYDLTRGYLGRVEFEIDWEKRAARVKNVLADKIYAEDLVPVRIKDRMYLTSAPLSHRAEHQCAVVYLYDEKSGTARLTSAFGNAKEFPPLFDATVIASMKGKTPSHFTFLWNDANGNGTVDLPELELTEKKENTRVALGRFDRELACVDGNTLYSVKEFRADGTPVYARQTLPAAGIYRLNDGKIFAQDAASPVGKNEENAVYNAQGQRLWGYPTAHPSVSGLWLPPFKNGYVTNQFAVLGHEVAPKGDLGEYFIIHGNNGQWNIWTADGFLAGRVLYHVLDKRSRRFAESAARGTRMDRLTGGQEHFHGFFLQSEKDGRAYIVAGHNFMSLLEVKGLDRFKRVSGEIKVTPEDLRNVREWEARQTRRELLSTIPVIECQRPKALPNVDGVCGENEWPAPSATLDDVHFTMTYDANNLYLCFSGAGLPALKNSGKEFQRYFKTGAALDFHIGADPKADLGRKRPEEGDARVLMTIANGTPQVVLYQPMNAKAQPNEAWDAFTEAAGKTHFDRVALLPGAKLAAKNDAQGAPFIEASIPLKDLNLQITPGLRLKMDWGVLFSDDGNQVKTRSYWANKMANGTSDESFESRLEPHLWGYVTFPGEASKKVKGPSLDREEPKGGDILDILER